MTKYTNSNCVIDACHSTVFDIQIQVAQQVPDTTAFT